jgi:N-acetylneuraminic acid mutarotase
MEMREKRSERIVCFIGALFCASPLMARELGLDERIRAQEAIERVYYSHQIGATRPFEEAVPRRLIEKKVLTYLRQTAALEQVWSTPLTSTVLRRELERIVRQTRRPDRLQEIFQALGNDPFLIQECVARPAVVARLARHFFASDSRFEGGGQREPGNPHAKAGESAARPPDWDRWWAGVEASFDARAVKAVASEDLPRSALETPASSNGPPCASDNTWDNGSLNQIPDPRRGATAVWTGSLMLVWGGWAGSGGVTFSNYGGRYDPATDTWTSISKVAGPSDRRDHTAIWTGSRMIIWGGFDTVATGGLYDPLTDTWTPTSITNVPTGRGRHSAIWTGSRMVIWGGFSGSTVVNTGGQYDPESDIWTATSTVNAPTATDKQSAVWTGSLMLVWSGVAPVPGGRYDPANDVWSPISTIGAPGGGPSVWTGSLMLVLKDDGTFAGGRYNPATDIWTKMSRAGAPAPDRVFASLVWTGGEMILWGGWQSVYLATGGRYRPDTDSWTPVSTANAPLGRGLHVAVWAGSRMLVWGGYAGEPYYSDFNTGGRYDPLTDSWTPTSTTSAPSNRETHTAIWTGNSMIVWGGIYYNGYLDTGGRYDAVLDDWAPVSSTGAPSARADHTAVWTGDRMVVWGGSDGENSLDTGGRYDPLFDTWTPVSTIGAPSGRRGHRAVWTGAKMIVWGGSDLDLNRFNTGGRYDPVGDGWTATSTAGAPSARSRHVAVWTGDRMIVWGGFAGATSFNTGGRYDPAADQWTATNTVNAPVPQPPWPWTAVWTGSRMLVWGAWSGGRYDPAADTWASLTAPSYVRHEGHSAIWTGNSMIVWGGGVLDDWGVPLYDTGGVYDPAAGTWTPTSTTNAPSPRAGQTAVWAGDSMLVWGGWSAGDFSPQLNTGGRYIFGLSIDDDGDGLSECAGDCNDANADVHPAAVELCNGVDDNCSFQVDEGGDALCDDSDVCTTDSCLGVSGCLHPLRDLDADAHADALCGGNDCNDANPNVWLGPSEVTQLTLTSPAPANPSWSSQAGLAGPETVYDLASGTVDVSHLPNFASAACLQSSSATSYSDARPGPAPGAAFWYLCRGRNSCGQGTYGSPQRDSGIPACP